MEWTRTLGPGWDVAAAIDDRGNLCLSVFGFTEATFEGSLVHFVDGKTGIRTATIAHTNAFVTPAVNRAGTWVLGGQTYFGGPLMEFDVTLYGRKFSGDVAWHTRITPTNGYGADVGPPFYFFRGRVARLLLDNTENVYMIGSWSTWHKSGGIRDLFLAKFSDGALTWQADTFHHGGLSEEVFGAEFTSDRDIVVGCRVTSFSYEDYVKIRRYTKNGALAWEQSLMPTTNSWYPFGFAVGPEDEVVIGGYFISRDRSAWGSFLTKLSRDGVIEWTKTVSFTTGSSFPYPSALAVGRDGSIFATEWQSSSTSRYNVSGELLWNVPVGGRALALDRDGDVIVGGSFTNGTQRDILALKIRTDGVLAWTTTFDGGTDDWFEQLLLDRKGDVYVVSRPVFPNYYVAEIIVTKFRGR